jgi:hypothetical protein
MDLASVKRGDKQRRISFAESLEEIEQELLFRDTSYPIDRDQ